jgi:MoxR-like ATPase
MDDEPDVTSIATTFRSLVNNIEQVLLGKTEPVSLALTCLVAGGHLLVEDVPGVGKTSLARCMAASIDGTARRIQFTPDLLPSDIVGVTIYDQQLQRFRFHEGPVFTNIVICDEINRASPKTQSALLEVMEEHRVSVDGISHPVPSPFMVVATQNPVDLDGTYALPEAQLDRFLMRLRIGYPDETTELRVMDNGQVSRGDTDIAAVLKGEDIHAMTSLAAQVRAVDDVRRYIVRLVAATRGHQDVRLGVSPRGSIALLRVSQVRAAAQGRNYVIPEDVQALAVPVLAHRIVLSTDAEMRELNAEQIVTELLDSTPVPRSIRRR